MDINKSYNAWAKSYDTDVNKTRDLDKLATRQMLEEYAFETVLELGCGTGKNTEWLMQKAQAVIAADFSEAMLAVAHQKIKSEKVRFLQADITKAWDIADHFADLVTCNLVLEHIADLDFIFQQARIKTKENALFFLSELHPFKQYQGSQARFETAQGVEKITAYLHHLTDYLDSAQRHGFVPVTIKEWFDDLGERMLPRLITILFRRLG